jgi:hypothetical protein
VLVAAALGESDGAAEASRVRVVELARSETAVLGTVSFPELFDARARQKLDGGFWNRTLVRINTRRVGEERPVALAVRSCRARLELWEEHYEVQVEDHTGRHTARVATAAEAIARCTTLTRYPVASLSALDAGRYDLEIIAELNPMNEELLEGVRRWLRSPQGGHRRLDQGDNFFGSVVSIFVNQRIGRSDRLVRFRSQPFAR